MRICPLKGGGIIDIFEISRFKKLIFVYIIKLTFPGLGEGVKSKDLIADISVRNASFFGRVPLKAVENYLKSKCLIFNLNFNFII